MTSLFSDSLLNDIDRDVRGTHSKFSAATARMASSTLLGTERSSAGSNPPLRDFAIVSKEMAKTQSLAASFRNISNYISMVERARNTIQQLATKLTQLDSAVSAAAEHIDNEDYYFNSEGNMVFTKRHIQF